MPYIHKFEVFRTPETAGRPLAEALPGRLLPGTVVVESWVDTEFTNVNYYIVGDYSVWGGGLRYCIVREYLSVYWL